MNDNCLEGMKCPKCSSEGPYKILGVAWFLVDDDGTYDFDDVDWDDNTECKCTECNFLGITYNFKQQ